MPDTLGPNHRNRHDSIEFRRLLVDARNGSLDAQGRLLEAFRRDLLHLAGTNLDSDICPKVAASDIVQDSLLEAHRDFGGFRGETRQEMRAWLKRILLNNLVNQARRWRSQKWQVGRELALEGDGAQAVKHLVDSGPSASAVARAREQQQLVEQAMASLKDDHRQVLELRHRDGLPFDEIGRRMDRTADSARMLWYRAFDQLSRNLDAYR
ncbi:MAG: sigma-70 family RNA polymerase sigma factor [Planctomycetes bacterium]|nr:sigma-70 family RNA polymerase sigma factor [Planctomycetota bacterium]